MINGHFHQLALIFVYWILVFSLTASKKIDDLLTKKPFIQKHQKKLNTHLCGRHRCYTECHTLVMHRTTIFLYKCVELYHYWINQCKGLLRTMHFIFCCSLFGVEFYVVHAHEVMWPAHGTWLYVKWYTILTILHNYSEQETLLSVT